MNIVKFADNRFQELRLQQHEDSVRKEYRITSDAETQALAMIVSAVRWVMKWLMVPKIFLDYLGVAVGIYPAPQAVIIDKLKAEKELAEVKDFNKKAQKIGANSHIKPLPNEGVEPLQN